MEDEIKVSPPWELTIRRIENGYLLVWYEPYDDGSGLYKEHCEFYPDDEMHYMLNAITDYFGLYETIVETKQRNKYDS